MTAQFLTFTRQHQESQYSSPNQVMSERIEKSLPEFGDYKYGTLNAAHIAALSDSLPMGRLKCSLSWFSGNARMFAFNTSDGVVLQGYYIPGSLYNNTKAAASEPSELDSKSSSCRVLRPVIFCSGWTETTVKSPHFLQDLNSQGHDIFSFDLRGQGFSDSALHYSPSGRKISHVQNFGQFVDDLQRFVTTILPEQLHKHTNNRYADASKYSLVPSYVGFSLSGLIALTLAARNPRVLGPRNRMVLMSPCIKPRLPSMVPKVFKALRYVGLDEMLLLKVKLDDPKARLTHSKEYGTDYFRFLNAAPEQLKIAGPSVGLMNEMCDASDQLLTDAPNMHLDLAILQAERDYLVDNRAQDQFLAKMGSAVARGPVAGTEEVRPSELVKLEGAYHVVLNEEDHIYKAVLSKVLERLRD